MLSLGKMKLLRDEYGLSYEYIQDKSGVPISTVQKVFGGIVTRPRRDTLEKLSKAFEEYADKYDTKILSKYSSYGGEDMYVAEGRAFYSKGSSALELGEKGLTGDIFTQSGYTYDDYAKLELPPGVRVEVIDGKLYQMASPKSRHQAIIGEVYGIFRNFIRANKGKCLPIMAPSDVRLEIDKGDMTVVQPDFYVVCDKKTSKGKKKASDNIPDFVMEVLSPSSRKMDLQIKQNKYRIDGVREYWVVDYDDNRIIKSFFETDSITYYTFDDKVPVEIYGGKLKVDFMEIKNYLIENSDMLDSLDEMNRDNI